MLIVSSKEKQKFKTEGIVQIFYESKDSRWMRAIMRSVFLFVLRGWWTSKIINISLVSIN